MQRNIFVVDFAINLCHSISVRWQVIMSESILDWSNLFGKILAQSTDENGNDEGCFLADGLLDVGVTGLAPAIPRIPGAFLLGHMPTE